MAALSLPVRAIASGALIGSGIAAWVDEVVFYHLLAWNNHVNTSTFELGQVLDNLVHATGIFTPLFGMVLAVDTRRRGGPLARALAGGAMLGAAAFRLVDSVVEHASTKLQQSHNPVEIALYDRTWTAVAVSLLLVGTLLALLPDRPLVPLRTLLSSRSGRTPPTATGQPNAAPPNAAPSNTGPSNTGPTNSGPTNSGQPNSALARFAGTGLRATGTRLRAARRSPAERQRRVRSSARNQQSS